MKAAKSLYNIQQTGKHQCWMTPGDLEHETHSSRISILTAVSNCEIVADIEVRIRKERGKDNCPVLCQLWILEGRMGLDSRVATRF